MAALDAIVRSHALILDELVCGREVRRDAHGVDFNYYLDAVTAQDKDELATIEHVEEDDCDTVIFGGQL